MIKQRKFFPWKITLKEWTITESLYFFGLNQYNYDEIVALFVNRLKNLKTLNY